MSQASTFPAPRSGEAPRVALFVTCLVNVMRPAIAECARDLLVAAGCRVEVPLRQTCCGQPNFNSGDREGGKALARHQIAVLEGYDYVVTPSGSCAGSLRYDAGTALADDPAFAERARRLAARTFEIVGFLHDVLGFRPDPPPHRGTATYHPTCSGLREMGLRDQPKALLGRIPDLDWVPLPDAETCCGFGGTFCVKYPAIANAVVDEKARAVESTGADILVGGDLGCLMNMAGKLQRRGSPVRVFHTVEALAGRLGGPALGEGEA